MIVPMHFQSICEVGKRLRSGEVTSVALTDLMLKRIAAHNEKMNAFITVTADVAREQARRADEELRNEQDRGPLHGIPVAVKDALATKGIRTTCGSKLFEEWIPDHDAAAVTRLRTAQTEQRLRECDVLAVPTATITAAAIADRPADGRHAWKNTIIFNFTGQPSISIPCGFTQKGLPVGLMLTGRRFEDHKVLQLAHAIEQGTEWHKQNPDI